MNAKKIIDFEPKRSRINTIFGPKLIVNKSNLYNYKLVNPSLIWFRVFGASLAKTPVISAKNERTKIFIVPRIFFASLEMFRAKKKNVGRCCLGIFSNEVAKMLEPIL